MTFERSLWQQFKSPYYWLAVLLLAAAVPIFVLLWFAYAHW